MFAPSPGLTGLRGQVMNTFKSVMFAGVATLSVFGCQSLPNPPELSRDDRIAALYALGDSPLPGSVLSDEDTIRTLLNSLNPNLLVEIGSVTPEAEGSIAQNVVFTHKDLPELGVEIGELRIFGGNEAFASQIKAGSDAVLAARIDARDVNAFGLQSLVNDAIDGYSTAIGDLSQSEELGSIEPSIGNYSVHADQIIMDGAELNALSEGARAFMDREPQDGEWEEFKDVFALLARWNMAFDVDSFLVNGLAASLQMQETNDELDYMQDLSVQLAINKTAYSGLSGGDVDLSSVDGMSYSMLMAMNGTEIAQISGLYDRYIIEDFRLSPLLDYVSMGEFPSMDVDDVMSLGVWTIEGENITLNGEPYYGVEHAEIDLSKWRWVIPTSMSFDIDGGYFSLESFADYFINAMQAGIQMETDDGASELEQAELNEFMSIAEQLGGAFTKADMNKLGYDYELTVDWDSETGAFTSDWNGRAASFMGEEGSLSIVLPNFEDYASTVPKQGKPYDFDKLGELFVEKFTLNELDYKISDDGGLTKIFALIHEIAKALPEEDLDDTAMMLRNTPPDQLRESMQGMMRMGAMMAASDFPPAVSWINAMADWVQTGGDLRIAARPDAPVGLKQLEEMSAAIDSNPTLLADLFGVVIEHTPDE